jgi:hypothetical protein
VECESRVPGQLKATQRRTSKYIHTLDTALIMAADTIWSYIQGLLDGIEFKQTAYALNRGSRKAALVRFMKRASH